MCAYVQKNALCVFMLLAILFYFSIGNYSLEYVMAAVIVPALNHPFLPIIAM